MKIIILMSTYNGENYLAQQLDSLLNQKLKPFKIIIRDDGSTDETINIIKEYSKKNNFIEYKCGENIGPGKSFFELINNCEDADYYCLCDQDDVWLEDKISSAINILKKEDDNMPLLYCSKYILTDEKLNPINSKISSLYNCSDFAHSLIYHTAPGCTFVFNNEARKLIMKYDVDKEYFVIHDAIIHKVVAMFGKVILDNNSYIYYRQHKNNKIGMNANEIKNFFDRINHFISGKIKNYRSYTAKSLLNIYGDICSEENKMLLNVVANYSKDNNLKKILLKDKRFKTHTINDFFFKLLVLVNYI